MREIVMDTETTGLDPSSGDRLVEIGGIELHNHFPTGRTWHVYIDPERDMPREAFAVHGLSAEFLSGKPKFAEIAGQFLDFVGDAHLVMHNASFDMSFLNAELQRAGHAALPHHRVVDTLMLARRRHPGGPNSLDDLCRRYGVDLSRRTLHGALLDAELLSQVYIELLGGRQARLVLADTASASAAADGRGPAVSPRPQPLEPRLTPQEAEAHRAFVATLGADAIWLRYEESEAAI